MQGWLTIGLVALFVGSAQAAPRRSELLAGLQSGLVAPGLTGLSMGPAIGFQAELSFARLMAVQLQVDQSAHWREQAVNAAWVPMTSVGALVQYRLDVAPVVPYAGAGIRLSRLYEGPQSSDAVSGIVALGFWVPWGAQWFAGAELRYGYEWVSGAFPHTRGLVVRVGWRSQAF